MPARLSVFRTWRLSCGVGVGRKLDGWLSQKEGVRRRDFHKRRELLSARTYLVLDESRVRGRVPLRARLGRRRRAVVPAGTRRHCATLTSPLPPPASAAGREPSAPSQRGQGAGNVGAALSARGSGEPQRAPLRASARRRKTSALCANSRARARATRKTTVERAATGGDDGVEQALQFKVEFGGQFRGLKRRICEWESTPPSRAPAKSARAPSRATLSSRANQNRHAPAIVYATSGGASPPSVTTIPGDTLIPSPPHKRADTSQ